MIQGILLDRDGTINVERSDYVRTPRELVLLPGALAALTRLASLRVPILVVTNQSCVGRGIVTRSELDTIHNELTATVCKAGGRIDGYYVCTHHPDEGCTCRKPQPGLLRAAMTAHNLRPEQCVMVGDALSDLGAAEAAGCRCILVCTGLQGALLAQATPDLLPGTARGRQPYIAESLWHASKIILEQAFRSDSGERTERSAPVARASQAERTERSGRAQPLPRGAYVA